MMGRCVEIVEKMMLRWFGHDRLEAVMCYRDERRREKRKTEEEVDTWVM